MNKRDLTAVIAKETGLTKTKAEEVIDALTDSIRDTLKTLLDSAWQGLVLAIIILFIFLCS